MRTPLMRSLRYTLLIAVLGAAIATLSAQTKTRPKTAPAPAAAATTTAATTTAPPADNAVQQSLQEILEEPSTPDQYHYDPQGRRDPFRSLIGPAPKLEGNRPPGAPGFLIDEMKLQGIVKTKLGFVGMIDGPDNKGYLIRVGDKVLDGEVVRITQTTVVFRQEVNDPTRIERYREVVKDLSPETQRKK
jgi:Tfp pilus assembly protein PilP